MKLLFFVTILVIGHLGLLSKGFELSLLGISHVVISILATAVLGLSACQATLLWGQNRWLKKHLSNRMLQALPPLETMEKFLFSLIWLGFLLLTATLITGMLYVDHFLSLALLPKTAMSIIAWMLFLILLIGHHQYGWRGVKAVHITLSSMFTMFIAYFSIHFFSKL
ncbi:MAG: cytochrome c biogenesis protein CcsA [Gammaproteobacteria bacterium]